MNITDPRFGLPEIFRILLVTLVAFNVGTLAGRIREYWRILRALHLNGAAPADADPIRAVLRFYVGYLVVLASIAWRVAELYHSALTFPLVLLAVGLTISLLGLRAMVRHVTAHIVSDAGRAALDAYLDRRRRG